MSHFKITNTTLALINAQSGRVFNALHILESYYLLSTVLLKNFNYVPQINHVINTFYMQYAVYKPLQK